MNAPEHTATACQHAIGTRLGDIANITGCGIPGEAEILRAMDLLKDIERDCRCWISALHLTGAAKHITRQEIVEAMQRPA